jgi:hypothetical protein
MSAEMTQLQGQPSAIERAAAFINRNKMEALGLTMTAVATLGGTACSGDNPEGSQPNGTEVAGTVVETTLPGGISGDVTPGDDPTVRAENAAGMYDCGGVKNEDWINDDGSAKQFTADLGLIPHLEGKETLAKNDNDFWVNVMGQNGFKYLVTNSYTNREHNEATSDFQVEGVSDEYEQFIENQVATVVPEDTLAVNHSCLNETINQVGFKSLPKGQATVTGPVIANDKFQGFVEAVAADGKDINALIIFGVDTDGNGENDAKMVVSKHRECGNNLLNPQFPPEEVTPETPETPTPTGGPTPTRPGQPTTTRGATTTVPTPETTVVTVPPKNGEVTPDDRQTPPTVEVPVTGPPNPTVTVTRPTETQPTIVVTVPTTRPEAPTTVTTVIPG